MYSLKDILQIQITSGIKPSECEWLYEIVKKYKPRFAIETGSGLSTLCILAAMRENGFGELRSIDLPYLEGKRSRNSKGDAVKQLWCDIRKHYKTWVVYEQDIEVALPQVVQNLPQVDFFFNDSRHTSEHVLFESNIVIPKMVKGSVFGMHDVGHPGLQQFVNILRSNREFEYIGRCRHLAFWYKGGQRLDQ